MIILSKIVSLLIRDVIFSNIASGTHTGHLTKLADAPVSARHLLAKRGSDNAHVALSGANDLPLGVLIDEASAAEDLVDVALLGSASCSVRMTASEAISQGELVYTAAAGKVQDLPATAGTYYCVGLALTATTNDGDLLEVDPTVPYPVTV